MKNFLIYTLVVLLFPTLVFAQNGLINSNQIAPVTVTVQAGEALTPSQVVSLINEAGVVKAYNNPLSVSTSPNGAESVFNSATSSAVGAVALDTTRFLVTYQDSDTYPKAIVGTVSGSTISWGSEASIENVWSNNGIWPYKIATDKVLVVYNDNTNGKMRFVVLSISTNSITVGTPEEFYNSYGCAITAGSLTALDTDKALFCWQKYGGSNDGYSKVITVSGTTPSASGSIATFNAAATSYISVSALSSTSAIVAYQDGGNSNYGTAQVLSISGTTITPGTEYVYKSGTTYNNSVCAMSSTKAIVGSSNLSGGLGYVATISGTAISYGAEYTNTSDFTANYHSIQKIDNTRFIWAFPSGAGPAYNKIGTLGDTTFTVSSSYLVSQGGGAAGYTTSAYLGSAKSVICFQDLGNSSYGTAVVNQWATTSYASVSGLSLDTYSSGSDAIILLSGTYNGLSGLIPGSPYFLQSDFSINTSSVSLASSIASNSATTREILIGRALSSTEILLDIDYR